MSKIIKWGKPDPEVKVDVIGADGLKTITFPRMSITLNWRGSAVRGDEMITYHPYEDEVRLCTFDSWTDYPDEDAIFCVAVTLKPNLSICLRVRGTNMKTLKERGEQFARFNFEVINRDFMTDSDVPKTDSKKRQVALESTAEMMDLE